MRFDVSVIIPAHAAIATIGRAVGSALRQAGVSVEIVICADDTNDYWQALPVELRQPHRVTLVRTPWPRSGPSAARNIAVEHARADIIAALDADDAYAPDRLRQLVPVAARHGVATGPTFEIDTATGPPRTARPRAGGELLSIEDICGLRMPFSPVYQREKAPFGWAEIAFAEDVIINVDLFSACRGYPFVEGADYYYHRNVNSMTGSAEAMVRARAGYLQILELIEKRPWPSPLRATLRTCIEEDLEAAEAGMAAGHGGADWRRIVRDGDIPASGPRVTSP